ncbi:MAG: FkbM family methyltransferase [Acidobacteriota bacterium]
MTLARAARALAGRLTRRLWPTPPEAAWRAIVARAAGEPRYTPGRLRVLDLDLAYTDAWSLGPQWHDIFVRESLAFTPASPAPRILDCGANIGLASIWLKRRFPEARITAFEADPALAAVLRENLAANRCADVEVVEAAVWRAAGRVSFRCEGSDSGAIADVAADTPGRDAELAAVRLRDWLAEPVDLVKLDIEGAELDVLEDCADRLEAIRALQMEVHDFSPARRLLPRCLGLLDRAGFRYALDDFAVASWRDGARVEGPFRHAVPSWIVLVRAWRPA